jgi:hypothetical protein
MRYKSLSKSEVVDCWDYVELNMPSLSRFLSDTDVILTHLLLLARLLYGKCGAKRSDPNVRSVLEDGSRCCGIPLWNPTFGLALVAMLPSLCILLTHTLVIVSIIIRSSSLLCN